jgi:mRNA interferase MazF
MKNEYRKGLGFDPRKYITASAQHTPSLYQFKVDSRIPQRGEVWFADLGRHPNSSVQGGCRPVIILSNNIGNAHADTVNIVPMTRHLKKPELPCHKEISPDDITDKQQLLETSMILAEQITTISKYALRNYAGRITDSGVLSRIEQSVASQLGIETLIKKKEENPCQSIS